MRSAVTIDTRPYTDDFIKRHLDYLTGDWQLVFFGSEQNKDEVQRLYPDCLFYIWDCPQFSLEAYSDLLISPEFWNNIPDEEILIFHNDSGLLKKGIEKFFFWDYVGSPWRSPMWGGNGGLSIRKRSISLKVIERQPIFRHWTHEDGYFCDCMINYGIGKLASREVCFEFACETIFQLGTYGYHNISGYLTKTEVEQIMNQYES